MSISSFQRTLLIACSELFRPIHPPNTLENNLAPEQYVGRIDPKNAEEVGFFLQTDARADVNVDEETV